MTKKKKKVTPKKTKKKKKAVKKSAKKIKEQKKLIRTIKNPHGQVCHGKAVMIGPMGWVINTGDGVPMVVNEGHNYLGHTPAKNRQPDHLGRFLHG